MICFRNGVRRTERKLVGGYEMTPRSNNNRIEFKAGMPSGAFFLMVMASAFLNFPGSAAELHWTGGAGDGFWTNKNNWTPAKVPSGSDRLLIDLAGIYTVTLNTVASVSELTVGATSGKQTLSVVGGALTVASGGNILTTGALSLTGDLNLSDQLSVQGDLNWTNGQINGPGAVIIAAPGRFDIGGTNTKVLGTRVDNLGTLTISAINLIAGNNAALTNAGLLAIKTNTAFNLSAPNSVFHNSGTINIESNASLGLLGGPSSAMRFLPGTALPGPGIFALESGTLDVNTTVNVSGTIHLAGGSLTGTNTWMGSGRFDWESGGITNAAVTTIAPGFVLNFVGDLSKNISGHLVNLGTCNWYGGSETNDGVVTGAATTELSNSGVFVVHTNCTLSGGGTFLNTGTLLRPAGGGAALLQASGWMVTNTGAIQVNAGETLNFLGANGARLGFGPGTTLPGTGAIRLTGGTLTWNCIVDLAGSFEIAGGTLNGTPIWTGAGTVVWSSGNFYARPVTIGSGVTFHVSGPGAKHFDGTVTNNGTIQWANTGGVTWNHGTHVDNAGLFVVQTDCVLLPGGHLANHGSISRPENLGKAALISEMFTNSGTILVGTNSTLTLGSTNSNYSYHGYAFAGGSVLAGEGTLQLAAFNSHAYGTINAGGTFELVGYLGGTSRWTGTGNLLWTGGGFHNGSITFAPEFLVNVLPSTSTRIIDSSRVTNEGTVVWATLAPLMVNGYASDGSLDNKGLFVLQASLSVGGSGYFQNAGTLAVASNSGSMFLSADAHFTNSGVIDVGANTVLQLGGNSYPDRINLAEGTIITGAGTTRCIVAGTLNGTIIVNGTCEIAANMYGTSQWTGPGQMRWSSGGFRNGSTTFAPGFLVTASPVPGPMNVESCRVTNEGTFVWETSGSLSINGNSSDGSFDNKGLYVLQASLSVGGSGYFQNAGILAAASNSGAMFLSTDAYFTNSGVIDVGANTVLQLGGNSYPDRMTLAEGTIITGAGTTRCDYYGTLNGTITVNGTCEITGYFYGSRRWVGSGKLVWLSGGFVNGSTIIGPGFLATVAGHLNFQNHSLTNDGTIQWPVIGGGGSLNLDANSSIANRSLLFADAVMHLGGLGTVVNTGRVRISHTSGHIDCYFHNDAAIELEGGLLSLEKPYAPSARSTHRVTLAGTTAQASYGQIYSGSFTFNGTLSIALTNGFVPTNGAEFTLANHLSSAGTFRSAQLPALPPSLGWKLDYSPSQFKLRVVSASESQPLELLPDGQFQFTLSEAPGSAYEILASTNLVDWVSLETNQPFAGTLIFVDSDSTNLHQRFYRGRVFE